MVASLRRFGAALVLLLALLLAAPAFAQSFPQLTGRVVDDAHLLSPEQAAGLTAKLAALEQQSGRQMVVATVPSLQDYPIEDYGYRLGRAWGLGDKKQNNGLLLLVAPTERKVRIEVGYGLEPIVTDALSSVVIQRQILPHFKQGDMPGGIEAGTDALIQLLQLPPDQAQAKAQAMVAADKKARSNDRSHIPFSLIFWIVVVLVIFVSNLRNRLGGGRAYRRGGIPPVIIWPSGGGGWGGGSSGGGWGGGGGGFSGGGGSFGGGGSSGSW